jgi:DTW domain-containing protein YfiP
VHRQRGRKFKEFDTQDTVLLYPSKNASTSIPETTKTVILIDATWKFAKNLYNKNTWLGSIPTIRLNPASEPIYAPLRKPPKPGYVSTAEALIITLEAIGDLECSEVLKSSLSFAVDVEHWQKSEYIKKYQSESNGD